jgi:uncharacterized protein (TIGR03067 family)
MLRIATLAALLTTAAFGFQPDPAKEAKELEKLTGVWSLFDIETKGDKVPEEVYKGFKLTITKEGTFSAKLESDERRGRLRIDPTKTPPTIDIIMETGNDAGKTQPGIYKLEVGQLTVCTGEFNKDRPADFVTKDKAGTTLLKFKKAK